MEGYCKIVLELYSVRQSKSNDIASWHCNMVTERKWKQKKWCAFAELNMVELCLCLLYTYSLQTVQNNFTHAGKLGSSLSGSLFFQSS